MEEYKGGNRKVQYLIAFSVSAVSVAMGIYTSWPAPVLPKFHDNQTNIEISKDEISWMLSMSAPGFMSGSLAARYLTDSFGRRTSLIGCGIPVATGTVIVAFGTEAWMLYLTRFLWGFGSGISTTAVSLYLAELADKEIRGSVSLISRFMFQFGNLLMMCIGPFVSYTTLNYMLLSLPMYFLLNWWIPESPYYCLKEGNVDGAREVLRKIRTRHEKLLEEQLCQMQSEVKTEMRHSSTAKELFTNKKYRRAVIIATGLKIAQLMSGQYLIQQYLGLIMKESGFKMELSTVFIIFGAVRFVVGVMSSILVDRIGRRPLLIYSYLGTGVCLIIISIYFFLLEVMKVDADKIASYGYILFVCIILSNTISILGFFSVIGIIQTEIFTLNIKAIAFTSLSIFGGLLNFVVIRGYQIILDLMGLWGVFLILGLFTTAGSVFSYFVVPETRGKSFKDIQIMLQGDLYEFDTAVVHLNNVSEKDDNRQVNVSKKDCDL